MVKVNYTSYVNGAIRDPQGRLVAFFDEDNGDLVIDSFPGVFNASGIEHAMDIVVEHFKNLKEA